jgi:hypothetical protein
LQDDCIIATNEIGTRLVTEKVLRYGRGEGQRELRVKRGREQGGEVAYSKAGQRQRNAEA